MEKIYKVFVSSTFTDLKEERKEVTRALLEMDCVPTGMEMFHASDKNQWSLIQRVIASCDFYIVIIAGRYGSVHPETQVSYTEMEYQYAYEIGIPIFAFIYENIEELPASRVEKNIKLQKKLKDFKKRVLNERMIRYWSNPYELASFVKSSIHQAIKDNPPGGWIRYCEAVNQEKDDHKENPSELLKQINELKTIMMSLMDSNNKSRSVSRSTAKSVSKTADTRKDYYEDYIKENIYKIDYRDTLNLSNLHVNALEEISNIIFSGGITSMSTFFGMPIKADFSKLQVCKSSKDVRNIISNSNKYGMLSRFYAHNVNGKIYLNFSHRIKTELVGFLEEESAQDDVYNYFISALQELSSIFTGTVLTCLAELLSMRVQMSASIINTDITDIDLFENEKNVFIIKFTNDKNEPNLIEAYLILEPKTVKNLFRLIGLPI